ncbi:DUF3379 family protein [Catenovulum sediminis]|uniref:DUF3379 family protein n=1 Tax=Catenovulum sediminis TaxID=1740262 RepID=UPI00117C2429|nr:DUF3379 family protein [Catenovulum sediminis]
MDDLEFRKRIYAEPKCQDDAVRQAMQEDKHKRKFYDEMGLLEQKIEQALDVPVSEGLQSKIILRQSIQEKSKQPKVSKAYIAIAASIAFVFGMTINHFLANQNSFNVTEMALAHVYHEMQSHGNLDLDLDINTVNAKLAAYGAQFEKEIGHIYSANFCQIKNTRALHLVLAGQHGQINVFIMPKANDATGWDSVSDNKLTTRSSRYQSADLIYVAPKAENLDAVQDSIENKISWRI